MYERMNVWQDNGSLGGYTTRGVCNKILVLLQRKAKNSLHVHLMHL